MKWISVKDQLPNEGEICLSAKLTSDKGRTTETIVLTHYDGKHFIDGDGKPFNWVMAWATFNTLLDDIEDKSEENQRKRADQDTMQKLMSMSIHDTEHGDMKYGIRHDIIKVPGGWIYQPIERLRDGRGSDVYHQPTFVPEPEPRKKITADLLNAAQWMSDAILEHTLRATKTTAGQMSKAREAYTNAIKSYQLHDIGDQTNEILEQNNSKGHTGSGIS